MFDIERMKITNFNISNCFICRFDGDCKIFCVRRFLLVFIYFYCQRSGWLGVLTFLIKIWDGWMSSLYHLILIFWRVFNFLICAVDLNGRFLFFIFYCLRLLLINSLLIFIIQNLFDFFLLNIFLATLHLFLFFLGLLT